MRKNKTRYVILGLLTESPLSGYDIRKISQTRLRFFWQESFGQIYPELARLEKEGLVTASAQHMDTKRPSKVYLITDAGKAALREWLALPPERETRRVEILLKLYFANLVPFESIAHHLSAFREEHQKDLQTLKHIETELRGIIDIHDNHPYILMTVLLGLKLNAAYVEWADEVTARLDDLKKERTTS